MYLSRLTLSRKPDVAALGQLLNPADEGRRLDAHHRLIWSAFAGDPGARRDFLWRDEGGGRFLVLSPRPPAPGPLFESVEPRAFAPDLRPGDRLRFLLRANATRTVIESDSRKRHRDVVMEALKPVPGRKDLPRGAESRRAPVRHALAQEAGRAWLEGQGARNGFRPVEAVVTAYHVARFSNPDRPSSGPGHDRRFGILDFEGVLEVNDPTAFLARFRWPPADDPAFNKTGGFGRAKAFGCGLMLIRRG